MTTIVSASQGHYQVIIKKPVNHNKYSCEEGTSIYIGYQHNGMDSEPFNIKSRRMVGAEP
jgi:hypothetical protein